MKTEHKVLVYAFLMGILVAVIDALLDSLFFYEGTFLELLLFHIPPHEFYIRSVVVVCFISFGFVVGRVINQREQAVEHSEYLYSVLSAIRNVNQLIVKETNHDVLLQRACELLIETRGYYHSWIVLFDDNGQLTGSASAGVGIEFEQMLEMVRRGEGGECMKRTMEQSGVLVFDTLPLEHEACPIKPLCREGIALVTRLESRVGIHGVLGVGAPVGMTAEEELSLFKEVANDIAYALYTFEVEDKGSRAHLALMENEKRFRLLYEDAPLCYQSLDEAGRFVEVNKAWLNLLEYSREEVIGHSFEEFLAPEEWDRFWAIFSQFKKTGEIHDVEFWMIHKDGSRFIASYDGTFIRKDSRQAKVCHCIFRDVTEQRRMEDELEESEKRHRMILSSMNDMIFVLDEHDCYSEFYASPSLMPYRTSEEFLGKNAADIMPLEIAEQMTELTKRVRETGNREIFEYELQMNEDELWFSAALDLHSDGESVIAVVREITKRKKTELELHNVNRALRAMSEVNAIVVDARDELKLLSDVCQVLVDSCGYRLAWAGFAEHDKGKTVRPVAQWGFEEGYLKTVDITWADTERGRGPTGTAIRTGEPITVINIHEDPKYAPWKAEATKRGYACAIALPLLEDGHSIGALNIYAKELNAFNPEEVNLLMELASSLAYGIRSVRTRVERMEVQRALKESEIRFRGLFEKSPIGIELYDIEGLLMEANQATLDIFGVSNFNEVKDFKLFDDPHLTDGVKDKIRRGESMAYQTKFDFEIVKEQRLFETSKSGIIHLDLVISRMILGGGNQPDTYIVHIRDITEKKQAEADLKFERERFIHVLNVLEDGIYVVDKNFDIEYTNLVIEREFGPVAGRKCYAYLHDGKEPCSWCKIDEVFAGNTVRWEWYSEKNNRYYDLLDTPMKNADGSISKFEIFRDITDGKLAENALKESEKQHRTLVSNIPGTVYRCELDASWTMLYLSDRFQNITGYPSSDIIANQIRSYESIIHPDDRKLVRDGVTSGVEQKKPFALEYRILHANGGVRWVQENGQAIFDQNGSVRYLDGVIHDITEHRMAEDALRQSEQMYRALFESANDAIFIMQDNLYLECNDMALKMFECSKEEILFHSPDEFSPKLQPDGSSSKKGALKRVGAALSGEPQFFEWKHTRCDGAFFDAEVGLNAVQVGDDLAIQTIIRDITDRKRAEKEIRTTAEAASLYMDLMGHDIRNHLQAIVMATEILTSTGLDANLSSMIDLITESVERSRNLIHNVQKTRGLLSAPLSEKSLKGALKNSLEVLKETYEDLEIEVDYKVRRAIIDADQFLATLLANLLENAVIHNNKRPRRVWVALRKAKGGFEISIADNGPGISNERKENLFDPERRFGGVGIHQALRIAQKYDGHINVDDRAANDSSQGVKFQLWLPRSNASIS